MQKLLYCTILAPTSCSTNFKREMLGHNKHGQKVQLHIVRDGLMR
jgi:hypothetical protein